MKKFQKPCYQTYLSKELNVDSNCSWKKIYTCKLTGIEDKKIAEFNYKLLNNILCNNLYLSKWNANKTSTCQTCNKMRIQST